MIRAPPSRRCGRGDFDIALAARAAENLATVIWSEETTLSTHGDKRPRIELMVVDWAPLHPGAQRDYREHGLE
jgi:hypothetical protein